MKKEEKNEDPGLIIIGSYVPYPPTSFGKVIIGYYGATPPIHTGQVIIGYYESTELQVNPNIII